MKLSVLLAGQNTESTKIVRKHLKEKIPYKFHEIADIFGFGLIPEFPVCYVGQYQTYGVREALEKVENFYNISVSSS